MKSSNLKAKLLLWQSNVESGEDLPHVALLAVDALQGRSSQAHNVFMIQSFSQNVQ